MRVLSLLCLLLLAVSGVRRADALVGGIHGAGFKLSSAAVSVILQGLGAGRERVAAMQEPWFLELCQRSGLLIYVLCAPQGLQTPRPTSVSGLLRPTMSKSLDT